MIANDQELEGTQERIAYFQRLLRQMRVAARVEEFPFMAGAYIAEVEKMHREVMDYLSRHASLPVPAETAPIPVPPRSGATIEPTTQPR
jgi:hypothetical protein